MNTIEILRGKKMKVGDTEPNLRMKLMDGDDPFNLDGYDAKIRLRRTDAQSDNHLVNANAQIVDAGRGLVVYHWQPMDTENSGVYLLEVMAQNTTTKEAATFPNRGYATVHVEDRL